MKLSKKLALVLLTLCIGVGICGCTAASPKQEWLEKQPAKIEITAAVPPWQEIDAGSMPSVLNEIKAVDIIKEWASAGEPLYGGIYGIRLTYETQTIEYSFL